MENSFEQPVSNEILSSKQIKENEQVSTPLVDALENSLNNLPLQFHIPGHTRGQGLLDRFKKIMEKGALIDNTDEFNSFGTLHPATGPIKKAQELMAMALGASHSYFLLNGSSIGNFAIAMSCLKPNSKAIIGRNCHRSVITGLIMTGATPVWINPQKHEEWSIWGEISPHTIETELKNNPDVDLVWITSPTYEGVISDIKAISDICKKYNVLLAVDEAHGALWNFSDKMPTSALELGADVVVHSMHKTGGSFSQSSILSLSKTSKINPEIIENNLRLLHTTSPSVTLLTSLDAARGYLQSEEGQQNIEKAINFATYIKNELRNYPKILVLTEEDGFNLDPARVYIMIKNLCGRRIENILRIKYNIEIEASTDNGILILSNIGAKLTDVKILINALKDIASKNYTDISYLEDYKFMPLLKPVIKMSPKDAFYKEYETAETKDAVGRISVDLIAECPPGIFVLAPGELITEEHLPYLVNYKTLKVLKEY
ncbi:MAG: aminotransferase class V-fold PLP-dependent enzyme [Candidatus Gastranaerophilales bacterium]|nr:aminotransferase class V-fold PLP-dependent enzyme [Candidatus Gastranaerophilales bacterium]